MGEKPANHALMIVQNVRRLVVTGLVERAKTVEHVRATVARVIRAEMVTAASAKAVKTAPKTADVASNVAMGRALRMKIAAFVLLTAVSVWNAATGFAMKEKAAQTALKIVECV